MNSRTVPWTGLKAVAQTGCMYARWQKRFFEDILCNAICMCANVFDSLQISISCDAMLRANCAQFFDGQFVGTDCGVMQRNSTRNLAHFVRLA